MRPTSSCSHYTSALPTKGMLVSIFQHVNPPPKRARKRTPNMQPQAGGFLGSVYCFIAFVSRPVRSRPGAPRASVLNKQRRDFSRPYAVPSLPRSVQRRQREVQTRPPSVQRRMSHGMLYGTCPLARRPVQSPPAVTPQEGGRERAPLISQPPGRPDVTLSRSRPRVPHLF